MQVSQLIPYSIGTATENKPLTTNELNVMPTEVFSATDGEVTLNPEQVVSKGVDRDGRQYETSVVSDRSVTAKWLPFGSNRATAPDVSRGEKVMLYRFADTDTYYWRTLGLDEELRRLETVITVYNANPKRGMGSQIDVTNCYYFEVSTHNKTVTFGTSILNGEHTTMHVQIDAGMGVLLFEDGTGQTFYSNAPEAIMQMVNNQDTEFTLEKQNILAKAVGNIALEAGADIQFKAGGNVSLIADGNFDVSASAVTIDTPTTSVSGNLAVGGNVVAAGSLSGTVVICSSQGSQIPGYD